MKNLFWESLKLSFYLSPSSFKEYIDPKNIKRKEEMVRSGNHPFDKMYCGRKTEKRELKEELVFFFHSLFFNDNTIIGFSRSELDFPKIK